MNQHNSSEDEPMSRLNKDTAYIEAKSKLPSHLCGDEMKILSDEFKAIAKMVLYEYTTAPGSMQQGEMLSNLEVRLRDLFEIMAKCKKILNMLNGRRIVAVFRAVRCSKKIEAYHEKLKRIRADLETTITRIKTSWGAHADNLRRTTSNKEQCLEAQDSPTTTPICSPATSALPYGRETMLSNVGNDMPTTTDTSHYASQRDQSSGIRDCNPTPMASLSSSSTNNGDTAPMASQISEQVRARASPLIEANTSVQPMSQEAPSASLSNATMGDLSLNAIGNDINNTVNGNARQTGVGNPTVLHHGMYRLWCSTTIG